LCYGHQLKRCRYTTFFDLNIDPFHRLPPVPFYKNRFNPMMVMMTPEFFAREFINRFPIDAAIFETRQIRSGYKVRIVSIISEYNVCVMTSAPADRRACVCSALMFAFEYIALA